MSVLLVRDKAPNQDITIVFSQDQDISLPLKARYEVLKCVDWIKTNNYSKVCLQFPESYLSDSVDVSLLIEEEISDKTYILGDTSYGSCCIDEVAAQHVGGDAVIHFGHTCLTQYTSLPALYILPKRALDLSCLRNDPLAEIEGSSLIIYDVGFSHVQDAIRSCFSKDNVTIPELIINRDVHAIECCDNCLVKKTGKHSSVRFSRGFCLENEVPNNVIYIGSESDPLFTNFAYLFKDSKVWLLSTNGLVPAKTLRLFKQLSYYTEEIKAANSLTVVVVSLSIPRVLEGIDYVKALSRRWNKRVYVITIAKPNIAKLTNFPEMEVFVILGCPETHLINNKEIIQPVVSIMEVELALNENRSWDKLLSKDFSDILPGGQDYIPLSNEPPQNASVVSNITGRLSGQTMAGDCNSTDLALNTEKTLASTAAKTGGLKERTWFGLEQALGETPAALAVEGRTGTSAGYKDEPH